MSGRGAEKMGNARRGIFFTIDALIALLIAGAIIFSIFSSLSRLVSASSETRNPIPEAGDAILTTLDNRGAFLRAISNTSAIYSELELAPQSLCWEINLVREDGRTIASAKKGGCSCREVSYSRRAIVLENATSKIYSTAEGRFCLK